VRRRRRRRTASWIVLVNRTWRPLFALVLIGVVIVNGIILPLILKQIVDLGALITGVCGTVPLIAARTWEKHKGVAD
jgi:hypothetical protein